ncbi:hypothetical protein GM415_12340 [Pseudodesulfovibrio cashew]|uniref:WbqC-like family protein n=1 Tax=Pseudodesulfovibrio cashew TaxID=2678688 RepID=A0A6I6JTB2_9BACT|nr:WbqC family protein [Pseudodesulfovibrio cashew]QGY40884.1 hypothetical protein GM415_12340 [Pseudodesulfovibrio cashew]
MSLSCAICQPHYLPWVGYFEMIDRVDVFVFLDDVQFIKREWKNRNRIRSGPTTEDTKWLTVPAVKEDQMKAIKDVRISEHSDWVQNHLNSIRHTYQGTPYFTPWFDRISEKLDEFRNMTVGNLNIALISWLCEEMGIGTKLVLSSDLDVPGKKEQKLINICGAIGADFYLANNATATYTGEADFGPHGIEFRTQDYTHPEYAQFNKGKGLPFISHLSVIDLLFNHDTAGKEILLSTRS